MNFRVTLVKAFIISFSILASSCSTAQDSFGMYKSQNSENLSKENISPKNELLQNFNSTVRIDNPHSNSLVNFVNITSPKSNHTSKKKRSFKRSGDNSSLVESECIPYTYVDPEVIKISDAIRITLLGSSDVSALRDNINHLKELSNIVVNQKIWIKTQNEIVRSFKDLPKEFKHLYNLGLIGEIEVRYLIVDLCIGCEDELIAKSALACKKNLEMVKKNLDDKKQKEKEDREKHELLFRDIAHIKQKTISELPRSEPIIPLNQDKVNEEEKVNAELIKSKEEAIKSQQHLDNLKKEAENANMNLEELKNQYKKEHTKFEEMQKELKVFTKELQEKEKASIKLTETIKKIDSNIAKCKNEYEQKEKEINTLRSKLGNKDLTEKQRKEYESCIAKLEEDKNKLIDTIKKRESERNICLEGQNKAQFKMQECNKKIQELEQDSITQNNKIDSQKTKIKEQEDLIKKIADNWPRAAWEWFKGLFRSKPSQNQD